MTVTILGLAPSAAAGNGYLVISLAAASTAAARIRRTLSVAPPSAAIQTRSSLPRIRVGKNVIPLHDFFPSESLGRIRQGKNVIPMHHVGASESRAGVPVMKI